MNSPANPNAPSGDRRLLRWILVLQILIIGWLAKNHFDGAFNRSSHDQPSAGATSSESPPSLEPSVQPNAPSSFSPLSRFSLFRPASPPPARRYRPAPDRIFVEMERMMDEANRAFANFDSLFGMDDAWAALPASPSMNLRELDDSYELSLAVPDASPDAFDVRLDGRLLSVSSRSDSHSAHSSSSQRYSSRLLLPGPVAPDAVVQVTNETGKIRIRIPKPPHPNKPDSASRQATP